MQTEDAIEVTQYPPEVQGVGAFDGGRITEVKPVGFPHEGPRIPNLGPLFYWAWATARGYGKIGLHPHQGFEIISYALTGEIGHYDTLGNESRVKAGGAQVMQTGSGVSHEEETIGENTNFFQIWFEPDLRKSVQRAPTYREFPEDVFPVEKKNGVTVKTVIGTGSPVIIIANVGMQDVNIEPGFCYQKNLEKDRSMAIVIVQGQGSLTVERGERTTHLREKDFFVVHAGRAGNISLRASSENNLRFAAIDIPAKVDYPLYRERAGV